MRYFIFLLLLASTTFASEVNLQWDDPGQDWITYVYASREPGNYDINTPVAETASGVNTATVNNLIPGQTYYFIATHYDETTGEESAPSNEISCGMPEVAASVKVVTELPDPSNGIKTYTITLSIPEND